MFKFIKPIFISTLMCFGSLSSMNPLECVSMNNQECKIRPEIVNVNSNEPLFCLLSIKTNKDSASCNNINDPYAKFCVPDVVKNLNIKVFNLILRTNETRHIKWHETCKWKFSVDASVCNNKQLWNEDKCMCECKELIDKGVCDKGSIWNPSNCESECDKSCNIGEYLDYSNCMCKKKLIDKLIEVCTESIDEVKVASEDEHKNKCSSCTLYTVLFSIFFAISIRFGVYYDYFYWYLKKDDAIVLYLILVLKQ